MASDYIYNPIEARKRIQICEQINQSLNERKPKKAARRGSKPSPIPSKPNNTSAAQKEDSIDYTRNRKAQVIAN